MIKFLKRLFRLCNHNFDKKGEFRKFGSCLEPSDGDLLGEVFVCKNCLKRKIVRF